MLAVAAAFRQEIGGYLKDGGFREVLRNGRLRFHLSDSLPDVVVAEGGLAQAGARECVRLAVSRFGANMIVSAGFAAGALPGQRSGSVVICDRLLALDGPAFTWRGDERMEVEPSRTVVRRIESQTRAREHGYATGSCITVPQLVASSSMKAWIGRTFGVSTMDMESYWVAEAANGASVPWVAVRVVLDPMEQDVSRLVGESLTDAPVRMALRAARHLAAHPDDALGLLKLSRQVGKSGRSLTRFLTQLSAAQLSFQRY